MVSLELFYVMYRKMAEGTATEATPAFLLEMVSNQQSTVLDA